MLRLHLNRPAASMIWRSENSNEVDTAKLHAMLSMPVIQGDYLYGIDSYGELRCLDVRAGARIWESQAITGSIPVKRPRSSSVTATATSSTTTAVS